MLLQEIAHTLLEADLDEHYGVQLDFIALLHENAGLANTLLQAPQHTLEILEDALIAAQASHAWLMETHVQCATREPLTASTPYLLM